MTISESSFHDTLALTKSTLERGVITFPTTEASSSNTPSIISRASGSSRPSCSPSETIDRISPTNVSSSVSVGFCFPVARRNKVVATSTPAVRGASINDTPHHNRHVRYRNDGAAIARMPQGIQEFAASRINDQSPIKPMTPKGVTDSMSRRVKKYNSPQVKAIAMLIICSVVAPSASSRRSSMIMVNQFSLPRRRQYSSSLCRQNSCRT